MNKNTTTTDAEENESVTSLLSYVYKSLMEDFNEGKKKNDNEKVGRDTDGKEYTSILEMWHTQGINLDIDSNNDDSKKKVSDWYDRASDFYEENCPETVDGVLGGYGSISNIDIVA
eukprot:CAMPEP_0194178614 /NCGR_PEP_ID=MMETSP0154-20130528/12168_1 /TAXON_ID=1049557 /ORGANISM="Thalassiothrix antarctica, Strain L6-D1" /LENGTH=115 /DNA_ID=CAMNT_0038893609 /DNA_START=20 /DNA_END=364 /DNA_ORIENTATION=+